MVLNVADGHAATIGRRPARRAPRAGKAILAAVSLTLAGARPVLAQGFLDQFSYEGLRLSGIGADLGAVFSDRLATDLTASLRVDYGFIAPHVRTLMGVGYFRSRFNDAEIAEFETRLRGIVTDPTDDFDIDVGEVTWTNVAFDLDFQYLIVAGRVLPYFGLGLGVHVRDARGAAIADTFVEDALETIGAVLNVTAGFEVQLTPLLRFTADGRGMLSSGLLGVTVRGGLMVRLPRGSE